MQNDRADGKGEYLGIVDHALLSNIGRPAAARSLSHLSARAAGRVDADEVGRTKNGFGEHARHAGRPRRHQPAASPSADERAISVVVADPNHVLRTAARTVLSASRDFVVYEATTFDELRAVVASKRPRVALVDFDLPPTGGLNAVTLLTERYPLRVVIWGFAPQPDSVLTVVSARTHGFLPKTVTPDALVRSIRGVAEGEACLSREMTLELIGEVHAFARRERSRRLTATLSTRESDVMRLVSGGFTNKQIAAALYISEFTVKRHIHNILSKLGMRSRRAAAAAFCEAQAAEDVLEALVTA
jgi:DNA-binding NarL/FixJ family response regulator